MIHPHNNKNNSSPFLLRSFSLISILYIPDRVGKKKNYPAGSPQSFEAHSWRFLLFPQSLWLLPAGSVSAVVSAKLLPAGCLLLPTSFMLGPCWVKVIGSVDMTLYYMSVSFSHPHPPLSLCGALSSTLKWTMPAECGQSGLLIKSISSGLGILRSDLLLLRPGSSCQNDKEWRCVCKTLKVNINSFIWIGLCVYLSAWELLQCAQNRNRGKISLLSHSSPMNYNVNSHNI